MVSTTSEHSATGHNFCSVGLACYEVTIDKSQFKHIFIVGKILQRELVVGIDMQQLYC